MNSARIARLLTGADAARAAFAGNRPKWARRWGWIRTGIVLSAGAATLAAAGLSYDVRESGAKGDGIALDGTAINRAIESAASAGGGTVVFPAGTYLSFSIRLKSHVTLYLEAGSTLVAAEPSVDLKAGYDVPEPNPLGDLYGDFGHSHWHDSLIWGEHLENVAILGPGKIFGRGLTRRAGRRDLLPEERRLPEQARPDVAYPASIRATIASLKPGLFGYPDRDTLPDGVGDKAIALRECRNVILRDFTVYHGGHFAILASGVDNLTVDNLKIDTHRDGVDIDCCANVRISNCSVNAPNDDAICLKSSFALGRARATENVTITNCQVSGFDEGTFLDGTRQHRDFVGGGPTGRIKLGTESNGGFRNISISNCVFVRSRGLAFESVDGALMEDITVSNISMRDIVNAPIFIRLGARLRGPQPVTVGTAARIRISDVVASNVAGDHGIILAGMPQTPLEDVALSRILIVYAGGGTARQADRAVPEMEQSYPDPSRYGIMPTYGLFARHVKNLSLDQVELHTVQPDLRPCLELQDVAGVSLVHLRAARVPGTPTLVLKHVSDLEIGESRGLPSRVQSGAVSDGSL